MKNILIVLSSVISLLILIPIIIENSRPFTIGLIDFSDNLYEKDFIDHSFKINFDSTKQGFYYFSDTIQLLFNDKVAMVYIEAYFNANWNDVITGGQMRYTGISIHSTNREDIYNILTYLESNLGVPKKICYQKKYISGNIDTVKYCEWEYNHHQITSNYYSLISDLDELYINRVTKISFLFNVYLRTKFWFYNHAPNFIVPNWYLDLNNNLNNN